VSKRHFYVFTYQHSGLPLALRLQDEGNAVTIVLIEPDMAEDRPKPPQSRKEAEERKKKIAYLTKNGSGLVRKMWGAEAMRELSSADKKNTYIIFDQIHGFKYGEMLRKRGFKVFGGTKLGYELETEREKTLALLQKLGITIPLRKKFNPGEVDTAIGMLKRLKDQPLFVFKSDNPAVVTTVAHDTNEELIEKITAERRLIEKDSFILQQKVEGVEAAVETWYNEGKPIFANVDIEAKKKYNEMAEVQTGCAFDLLWITPLEGKLRMLSNGPFDKWAGENVRTGVFDLSFIYQPVEQKLYALEVCGCFDPETEVLTKRGWLKYTEIRPGDETLSINPETLEIDWKPILNVQIYPYNGKLIRLGNNGIKTHSSFDALVTPNHKWLVKKKSGRLKITETQQMATGDQVIRVGKWKGVDAPVITIPEYTVTLNLKPGLHMKGGRYGVFPFIREEEKSVKANSYYPPVEIQTEDFMKFVGIYLAEGSSDSCWNGIPRRISITQKTKRNEVREILDRLPFQYTEQDKQFRISNIQLTTYLYKIGILKKKAHEKSIPFEFKQLAPKYLKALLDGFILGDGHVCENGKISIATCSKKLADDLQEIIHKIGWVSNITVDQTKNTEMTVNGRTYRRKHNQYLLYVRQKKVNFQIYRSNNQNLNYREKDYQGNVWCAEVKDWHTLFVRRNGKAYFSGNSRPAYNAIYTMLELLTIPVGDFFADFLDGKFKGDVGGKLFRREYAASLRLFNDENQPDQPIKFPKEEALHVWLWDVYGKGRQLYTTGDESFGIITSSGENPESALAKLRELFFKVHCPTKWARDDFEDEDEPGLPLCRYHALKKLNLL